MLRITEAPEESALPLRLDGQVSGTWVELLRETCARRAQLGELDLTGVDYVDREGVKLLVDLRARGVRLTGCSPLVELLLDLPGRNDR